MIVSRGAVARARPSPRPRSDSPGASVNSFRLIPISTARSVGGPIPGPNEASHTCSTFATSESVLFQRESTVYFEAKLSAASLSQCNEITPVSQPSS